MMFASATDLDNPFETNDSVIADHMQCRTSLSFLVLKAFMQLFNEYARIFHHIGSVTFVEFASGRKVTEDDAAKVEELVINFIKSGEDVKFFQVKKEELANYWIALKRKDKADIVRNMSNEHIAVAAFDGYIDYIIDPMKGDLSKLSNFRIDAHVNGMLRISIAPPLGNGQVDQNYSEEVLKLSLQKRKIWGELELNNLMNLNGCVSDRQFNNIRMINDEMHAKNLDTIVDKIISQCPRKRVISIAGSSASGKTTLSKPIKNKLEAEGYKCVVITMDDYFVDRADMIPNAKGKLEFESINTVLSELLGERIRILLNGGKIPVRGFDFFSGTGKDTDEMLEVGDDGFIIFEGIHAINPNLLKHFGDEWPFTVYVAPVTPLPIDNEHVVSIEDLCLIRRILRDNEERGYSPRLNIMWWDDVREGEEINIAPYVKNADIIFDSSFCFELHMKQHSALKALSNALIPGSSETERDSMFRSGEIHRFLKLFSIVEPLSLQILHSDPLIQNCMEQLLVKI